VTVNALVLVFSLWLFEIFCVVHAGRVVSPIFSNTWRGRRPGEMDLRTGDIAKVLDPVPYQFLVNFFQ
jgi:hypothetical protein